VQNASGVRKKRGFAQTVRSRARSSMHRGNPRAKSLRRSKGLIARRTRGCAGACSRDWNSISTARSAGSNAARLKLPIAWQRGRISCSSHANKNAISHARSSPTYSEMRGPMRSACDERRPRRKARVALRENDNNTEILREIFVWPTIKVGPTLGNCSADVHHRPGWASDACPRTKRMGERCSPYYSG